MDASIRLIESRSAFLFAMKQIDPNQIESPEQQERRARRRLRPKPLIICALIVGAIVLVVPAGGPWMSQEAFISAMGRIVSENLFVNLITHFVLVFVYAWIVASCIYSFRTAGGIALGTVLGLPLYGINYLFFAVMLGYTSNELHVAIAHLVFCLLFSAAYKAAAVPPPRWRATGEPVETE
jgi:hypothetical protein